MQAKKYLAGSEEEFRLQKLIFGLAFLYFIFPAIVFIPIGDAGIKMTDFIATIFLAIILLKNKLSFSTSLLCFCSWYAIKGFASLDPSNIFFGIRFFEYMIVIQGILLLNKHNLKVLILSLLWGIILISLVEITLMNFGIELSAFINSRRWGQRLTGVFSGPFELGAICILLIIYFRKIAPLFLLIPIILLTDARASILTLPFVIFIFRPLFLIPIIPVIAIYLLLFPSERLVELFLLKDTIFQYIQQIISLFNSLIIDNSETYRDIFFARDGQINQLGGNDNLSILSRVFTYVAVFLSLNSPSAMLLGNYPGFYGVAIDSSFIRILGEAGIVGLLLIFLTFIQYSINYRAAILIIAFSVNAFFVDILFTSKSFVLLFVLLEIIKREKKASSL